MRLAAVLSERSRRREAAGSISVIGVLFFVVRECELDGQLIAE